MENHHAKRSAAPITGPEPAATVLGAVAGAVGVWVMDQVGWLMLRTENTQALARDFRARPDAETGCGPGTNAQVRAVRRSPMFGKNASAGALKTATQVSGVSAPDQRPGPAATAFHYGLGMLPGALYANARRARPSLGTGCGALYGLGLFVVMDETAAPLSGIASPPGRYPWQTHVRGLTAHLLLGITTEALLRTTDHFRQTWRR